STASGVTGTWHLDLTPMIEAQKGPILAGLKQQMAMMKQGMDALTPDQRDQAMKAALEQVPAEQRDLVKAMFAGEKEGEAAVVKMLNEQMGKIKTEFVIKDDKTWSGEATTPGKTDKMTGSWTQDGNTITLKTETKDGKPAAGEDAKSL